MDKETGHDPNIRVMSLSRLVTRSFLGRHGGYARGGVGLGRDDVIRV